MIHFDWPWLAALLPLPLLVRWLMPAVKDQQEAALRVPFIEDFAVISSKGAVAPRSRWKLILAALAWTFLVLATMRPQWLGEAVEIPVSGRDLMMAVDLSLSMEQTDFELKGRLLNRLDASKIVAGDFIERRVGDRIGLILFGERAYLQAPLTFDRTTVRDLLEESALGLAGKSTAIGDAIGLAVKRIHEQAEREAEERAARLEGADEAIADEDQTTQNVLILLTDGANTAGKLDPLLAAELAARENLKIYTIGIGSDQMQVRGIFGVQTVNPSRDLDEKTLTAIADRTGGQYFRARDTEELAEIYAILDELEPVEKEAEAYRPRFALFHWPAGIALAMAGGLLLLRARGV